MPRHQRCAILAAAAAALVGLGAAPSGQSADQGVVYVAVMDQIGKPIVGLRPDAFHVWEGTTTRDVTAVALAAQPPSVVIIVHGMTRDDGPQDVRKAVGAVLDSLRRSQPEARVALITEVRTPKLVGVTSGANDLDKTASRFAMSGSNLILLEAISDACRALAKEPTRRRVIMVITNSLKNDGADQSADQAVAILKNAGASLWTINYVPGSNKANLNSSMSNEKDNVLTMWTTMSGGFNDQVFGTSPLEAAAVRMTDVILSQYEVRYSRPPGPQVSLRLGVAGTEGDRILAPRWSLK
ncbi:MAG TPA: hypothetical protein VLT86_13155 [Vicinamibacterales bacterium]|nr:hypothetical protein [Vicinamibacterales bacterium]